MNAARGERNRSASPPRWLRARLRPHFDVLSTFAAQALALVAGLATGVITARVLGAHGRGELTLALLIPAIASLLFGAGAAGATTAAGLQPVPSAMTTPTSTTAALGSVRYLMPVW